MRRFAVACGLAPAALALSGLAACGESDGSAARDPLPSVGPVPDSYRFVLESSCGERTLIGRFDVVVRDGRVASVESLDPTSSYRPDVTDVPTLAGLAELAESAEPGAEVDLQLDEADLPRSLSIDHDTRAMDDEECYEVSDLVIAPA